MPKKHHWIGTLGIAAPYSLALMGAAWLASEGEVMGAGLIFLPATLGFAALMVALWSGKMEDF